MSRPNPVSSYGPPIATSASATPSPPCEQSCAEVAMGGPYDETGFGLDIDLTTYGLRLAAVDLLFSESHGRAVITCPPARTTAVAALAQELGVPAQRLGTVAERGGAVRLRLRDATVEHPVARLRQVYFSCVSRRMGD